MKIKILGVDYDISFADNLDGGRCGATNFVNKTIKILNDKSQTLDVVLRHEIMHAMFYESGLLDYATDEVLVDYIAAQYPKMKKLFEDAEKDFLNNGGK